jgi:hypothetical protein
MSVSFVVRFSLNHKNQTESGYNVLADTTTLLPISNPLLMIAEVCTDKRIEFSQFFFEYLT